MSVPRSGTLKRQVFDAMHAAHCGEGCELPCRRFHPNGAEIDAAIATVRAAAVNEQLTRDRRQRRRRYTETQDFGRMVVRLIRAFGKRCESADMDELRLLISMQTEVDQTIRSTITRLRKDQEFSWSAIAEATGTTRQGAQQRWGRTR